jgi:hypothetical protein
MSEELKLEYDEVSPITGELDVMVEEVNGETHKFCLVSGFTTRDDWSPGSEACVKYEESLTKAGIEKKVISVDNLVWYPVSMSVKQGVIFFDKDGEDYIWKVCPTTPIPEDKKEQYPGVEVELNLDNSVIFKEDEFQDALTEFYKIQIK